MKKIKVSRINNFKQTNKFSSARIVNHLLLQTGFEEGKIAKINYKNGRLIIKLESNFINIDE